MLEQFFSLAIFINRRKVNEHQVELTWERVRRCVIRKSITRKAEGEPATGLTEADTHAWRGSQPSTGWEVSQQSARGRTTSSHPTHPIPAIINC